MFALFVRKENHLKINLIMYEMKQMYLKTQKSVMYFPVSVKMLIYIIASIFVISCSREDDEDFKDGYLHIDTNTVSISSAGNTISKMITSNVSWNISTKENYDWINISPTNGTGNAMIQISISPNYSSERYADIYISSTNPSVAVSTLCIYQKGENGTSSIKPPTGVSATISGSSVYISWNTVSTAIKYNVYRSSSASGIYSLISTVSKNNVTDSSPLIGYNYYRITAVTGYDESEYSSIASVYVSNAGAGTEQKPVAPTGITVSNEGNNYIPDVRIRWNSVSNATKYYIYKSSSANGSYYKIGENSVTSFSDSNAPTNGGSAYYKVKAVNSAGESEFSNYAKYTSVSNDEAFAPAYRYGSCSVSGNTMTLRWTNSSGYGYGKATDVILRVWNPYSEEWQDTKVSATATYASFNYSTKIDNDGYVKAGIVVSNSKGSYTAGAKVYDTKSKRWLN